MLIQGQVGVQALSNGSQSNMTLGRSGEQLVSEWQPRYYSLVKQGLVYGFSSAAITVAATHVSRLSANTGTPVIGIWNPANSGKDIVILKHGISTVSGQPGGPFVWNYGLVTTTAAALSTVVNAKFGQSPSGSIAAVYSNVVTTSSLAGVLAFHAAAITNITGAGNGGPSTFYDDRGGDILIPPGAWGALAATVTGTSHVIQASVIWAEIAV